MTTSVATVLGAPPGDVYDVHGIRFRVRSDDPAALAAVAATYASFAVPADLPGPPHATEPPIAVVEMRHEAPPPGSDASVLGLLDRVVDVILAGLASRGILALHAATVVLDGRAWLIAGHSGAGKSTLTLGLVRDGAGWLTDELTLVERDDRTVLPYPRAIHVSSETLRLVPELGSLAERPQLTLGGDSEWSVTADDVARGLGGWLAPATPLGGIIVLGRRPAPRSDPRLEPMSPALATMELLRQTPAAARELGNAMARVARIASSVPTLSLTVGRLDATVAAIRHRTAR